MKIATIVDAICAMKSVEDYMIQTPSIPMREVTKLTIARVGLELAIDDIEIGIEPFENDGGNERDLMTEIEALRIANRTLEEQIGWMGKTTPIGESDE